jgi:hypothetical protein
VRTTISRTTGAGAFVAFALAFWGFTVAFVEAALLVAGFFLARVVALAFAAGLAAGFRVLAAALRAGAAFRTAFLLAALRPVRPLLEAVDLPLLAARFADAIFGILLKN